MKNDLINDVHFCTMLELAGHRLSSQQAKLLETRIKSDPHDLESRILLFAYSGSKRFKSKQQQEIYIEQLLWLIDNCPDLYSLHSALVLDCDEPFLEKIKNSWSAAVIKDQGNIKVLSNAGYSMMLGDRNFAENFLKQALALNPLEIDRYLELSQFYKLEATHDNSESSLKNARKALKYGKSALALQAEIAEQSYIEQYFTMVLTELSDLALQHHLLKDATFCGEYAIEHAMLGTIFEKRLRAALGHSILGLVKCAESDLSAALEHLSKLLEYGNPEKYYDLKLASFLFKAGERKHVQQYVQACADEIAQRRRQISDVLRSKRPVGAISRKDSLDQRLVEANALIKQIEQKKRFVFPEQL